MDREVKKQSSNDIFKDDKNTENSKSKGTRNVGTSPKLESRKLPLATLNKIRDSTIQSAALRLRTLPRGQRNETCTEFNRTISREIDALEKEIRRPEADPQIQSIRGEIVRESLKLGENMAKLLKMTLEKV